MWFWVLDNIADIKKWEFCLKSSLFHLSWLFLSVGAERTPCLNMPGGGLFGVLYLELGAVALLKEMEQMLIHI